MPSRAAELARAEADEVEREETETETETKTDGETAPEPEPEPESEPADEASAEAQLEALSAYMDAHEAAMAGMFGDDWASMRACATCNGFGFTPVDGIQAHPETERCAACAGHGVLLSGSQNEAHVAVACEKCGGQGYTRKLPPTPDPVTNLGPQYIYVDPATGLQVHPNATNPPAPNGTFAPGYVPQGQPLPPGVTQT